MKKIVSLFLCFLLTFSLLSNFSVSAKSYYSHVYDENGEEVFKCKVDVYDSKEGIQDCFRYVRDVDDEGIYTVKLDKTTYRTYGSLDIFSNIIFDLNGSTIRRADKNCPSILRFGAGDDVHYGYNGFENVTVKNGTFDAARLNNVSMVRFAHAKNVIFENVDFRNTVGTYHMLTFAACDGVEINNCGFYDMDTKGLNTSANGEALQIDVLIDGHFSYPAQDFTPTKNVKVTNCTFKNLSRGLGTHSAVSGHYFENMEFSNNTFENIDGYAIKTVNYRNSKISNNIIKNCGSGIYVGNMTNKACGNFYKAFRATDKIKNNANLTVENNTIDVVDSNYNALAFGIQVYGAVVTKKDFAGDYRVSGITIKNNNIVSSVVKKSYYGVWLQGVNGNQGEVKISGNSSVYSPKQKSNKTLYGVRIEECKKIEFSENSIYDTCKTAVIDSCLYVTDCSDLTIQSNTFKNTKTFGVKFDRVTNTVFKENKVSNTKNNAVYVNVGCEKLDVISNKITNSSNYGIVLYGAKGSSVSKNTLGNIKQYCIYFKDNSNYKYVSSNYIYNVKSSGIYMNSNAKVNSVSENTIDMISSTKSAIYINDRASVKYIKDNKINTKINSQSKKLKVKCYNGIYITSNKCNIKEISNNTVKSCVDKAIGITQSNPKPSIDKNIISNCNYGIRCYGGKISNNKISNAKTAKIKLY